MKIITSCACDKCGKIIEPYNGYIIQGNITMITPDLSERGGLIGNAFFESKEDGNIKIEQIKEYAYHDKCLSEILKEHMVTVRRNFVPESEENFL
jgi:hypothetical protein